MAKGVRGQDDESQPGEDGISETMDRVFFRRSEDAARLLVRQFDSVGVLLVALVIIR
jgi:hypothetical protein